MPRNRLARALSFGACLAGLTTQMPVRAASTDVAEIKVDGVGLLRDRELQAALRRLLDSGQKSNLDANAIEDAAVILTSSLSEEGFMHPTVDIIATLEDGTKRTLRFDPTFERPLPRGFRARAVQFKLEPGLRYYIADVEISGLTVLGEKQARAFFLSDSALYLTARGNAFSPSRLSRAADALLAELRQRGRAEAVVKVTDQKDEKTGRVTVRLQVEEGPEWVVAEVTYQRDEDDKVPLPPTPPWIGKPWSSTMIEDIKEAIRQTYYRQGYPDVGVHVEAEGDAGELPGRKATHIYATIVPGSLVKMGEVRFTGRDHTRESVLRRRVTQRPGEPLNLISLERARYRISRLGVFEAVDLRYEPEDGEVRDAVFSLREAPLFETSLLMGYGSYEQLRGGIEHRQKNIFGLAHQSRLELVQSMKSSSGEYTYAVPELFGESLDGTARLFGLQRKEIAFLRQEFGLDLALKRALRQIGGEATVGYTFKAQRAHDNSLSTQATDNRQLNSASLNFGLKGDRRDNPLRPRHGYHWSTQAEFADPRLGGQAAYQRFEVAGAYHTNWSRSRWIHVGLSHGAITTAGSDGTKLPVNSRFYPGGDNSIRGYQRGEAAPRGPDGLFIGAKSFILLNLELEQAVTPNWSVVLFGDALGMAEALRDYPVKEKLYSVGLGLRYQTLIGPVRLEYGRNVNPRMGDPSGTWQFSIGYPF